MESVVGGEDEGVLGGGDQRLSRKDRAIIEKSDSVKIYVFL
jgi:hypothetical protein